MTATGRLTRRHWRSYSTDPLPTPAEALDEPFSAFPSWFLRIECERCGKVRLVNQINAPWSDRGRCATSSPAVAMTAAVDWR